MQTLKTYFGYDAFRPGQEEIIDQILSGRDVLAVMPTGAGKSLCYQLPALLMPGITVVVSPLISLMMDQVKALNESGVHAAYINSSLTEAQITKALELAAAGRYKIIYVAPERLETPQLCEEPVFYPAAPGAAGDLCIYGDSDRTGPGGYPRIAGTGKPF